VEAALVPISWYHALYNYHEIRQLQLVLLGENFRQKLMGGMVGWCNNTAAIGVLTQQCKQVRCGWQNKMHFTLIQEDRWEDAKQHGKGNMMHQ
jgi:hypothetical protein